MPKIAQWFFIAITIAAIACTAVRLNNQRIIDQEQATCRARAADQYHIITGWILPVGYPSHYDATLKTCTFFYQSFPPKTAMPEDYWVNANSGSVLAEENDPGDAFKETCFFQDMQVDCADFERATSQIMSQ